jgi:nitric oxide reductase activation protein
MMLVCLAAIAPLAGVAQGSVMKTNGHTLPPILTDPPDKNAQIAMQEGRQEQQKQNFAAANAERKKQIAEDTEKLLKLATDLKTEVDKTDKDTLSLNVIRKAEAIEKLAHNVKEKMKLTAGPG